MQKHHNIIIKSIIIVVVVLSVMSCTRHKKTVYFYNLRDKSDTISYFENISPGYLLKPGDILHIRILSINEDISKLFNANVNNTSYSQYYSDISAYINGYSVNDSGYIFLPVLGLLKVEGKTVGEAQLLVQQNLDKYLKGATAVVKLLTYKITVLGEVARPGVYTNYNDNITVLRAIGMAGDITLYGNKENILVIRPTKDGTETYRINLNNAELLESSNFYVLPNDIIYVEPVKSKIFRLNSPNISIAISSITTLILVLNFIIK